MNRGKSVDWLHEVAAYEREVKGARRISDLDEHLVEILALRMLRKSWEATAIEVNHILNLNGAQKLYGKKLSRIASRWKMAGMIDLEKVEAFHVRMQEKLAKEVKPKPPAIPPLTSQ